MGQGAPAAPAPGLAGGTSGAVLGRALTQSRQRAQAEQEGMLRRWRFDVPPDRTQQT
jgi:hypothetical protein